MQSARIQSLAKIGAAVIIGWGPVGALRAQSSQLPTCTGWSNCNPGRAYCTIAKRMAYFGPTVIADLADGVSSDGRGPYIQGTDGVGISIVALGFAHLAIDNTTTTTTNPRHLTVNLNNPVPGGGSFPLGIITAGADDALHTQWSLVGDTVRSLLDIPVGQTVPAAQMNVSFHINGRFHILQMGPQPLGHCHSPTTLVNGTGTSSGTIYRASQATWVMDLPSGSVGRLFDVSHTTQHATDKGLYYVHLHYEIANAVPAAAGVLRPLAETQGAAAVVARYRAMKRDSAQAYFFDENQLTSAAYWLLDNKQPQDALIVFLLNVEEYPDAWSPYDGLGESYLAVGDTSRAIANYRRSLELNPTNQAAADVLKRLGANP
jgi:hypothetical protein